MTKGLGVGEAMLGKSTGDLVKPGLTKQQFEEIVQKGPDSGTPDPFGDLFRESQSAKSGGDAAPAPASGGGGSNWRQNGPLPDQSSVFAGSGGSGGGGGGANYRQSGPLPDQSDMFSSRGGPVGPPPASLGPSAGGHTPVVVQPPGFDLGAPQQANIGMQAPPQQNIGGVMPGPPPAAAPGGAAPGFDSFAQQQPPQQPQQWPAPGAPPPGAPGLAPPPQAAVMGEVLPGGGAPGPPPPLLAAPQPGMVPQPGPPPAAW